MRVDRGRVAYVMVGRTGGWGVGGLGATFLTVTRGNSYLGRAWRVHLLHTCGSLIQ